METDDSIIFIIDDDPFIRESLQELLRSAGRRAWAFESTQSFLRTERPDCPCCLVLDVRLPDTSGLEFQRDLAAAGISMPIIFITGHGDVPMSVAAMKAGAIEFLLKPFSDQDFLDAVARGLELDRNQRRASSVIEEFRHRHKLLTPRERDVMTKVVAGLLNKQIAAELGISLVTVKVHRAHVMRKMQVSSVPDLVRIAERLSLGTCEAQGNDTMV